MVGLVLGWKVCETRGREGERAKGREGKGARGQKARGRRQEAGARELSDISHAHQHEDFRVEDHGVAVGTCPGHKLLERVDLWVSNGVSNRVSNDVGKGYGGLNHGGRRTPYVRRLA